jgi:hypothetical protein
MMQKNFSDVVYEYTDMHNSIAITGSKLWWKK